MKKRLFSLFSPLNIFKLFIVLVIFPEFGFFRLASDTQPLFFIITFFSLLFSKRIFAYFDKLLIPFFIVLVFATLSFISTIFKSANYFLLFRSYFGYISSFFVLFYLFVNRRFYKSEILTPLFDFSIFLIYIGFFLNILGLNWLVKLFVNRAKFDFEGFRGLVSFYSEQSNMVSSCYILFFLYLHLKSLNKKRALLLLVAIFLSASGQAIWEFTILNIFYFASVFVFIIIYKKIPKDFIQILVLAIIAFLLMAYILNNFNLKYRAFEVFSNLDLNNIMLKFGNDYSITWKVQGLFLAISTLIATPFIFQISSLTETDSFSRLYTTQYEIYNFFFGVSNPKFGERVFSAVGTWIVDFGIYGLLLVLFLFYLIVSKILKGQHLTPLLIVSILYTIYVLLVKISLSNPTIILLLFSTYIQKINSNHLLRTYKNDIGKVGFKNYLVL